jgi:hypothetical protein
MLVSAVAIAVVLAVAGYQGWRYWQTKQAEAAGEAFFTAARLINEGKHDEAQQLLAGVDHAGYALLAKFRLAADLASQGKTDAALTVYGELASNAVSDKSLRELARVRAGYLEADKLPPSELVTKLGDLDQEGNVWRNPVREIIAIAAYRTGDYQMADKYVNTILGDPAAAPGLRQRAQMMADLMLPLLDKPKSP